VVMRVCLAFLGSMITRLGLPSSFCIDHNLPLPSTRRPSLCPFTEKVVTWVPCRSYMTIVLDLPSDPSLPTPLPNPTNTLVDVNAMESGLLTSAAPDAKTATAYGVTAVGGTAAAPAFAVSNRLRRHPMATNNGEGIARSLQARRPRRDMHPRQGHAL